MPVTIGSGLSFCGQPLTAAQLDLIRQVTREFRNLALTELSHTLCELLEWKRPNGSLKSRECYLFLQALHQRGWLPWLPAPRPQARRPHRTALAAESDPQAPCGGPLERWLPLQFQWIDSWAERQLFEQYIHRYHYLGYRVPYGAQLRYFIASQQPPYPRLACLLFTSAAWKMAPRDHSIGWSEAARRSNLPRVVNNSRFLILPHGHVPNLGSHILSLCEKRLPHDWQERFGHPVLLLETFVDPERFQGTVYKAANWTYVGNSRGFHRTRKGYAACESPKMVFLKPLRSDAREQLSRPILEPSYRKGGSRIMLSADQMQSLPSCFAAIPDPRRTQGRRHRLRTVLALCAGATLCGMRGYKAIADWAQSLTPKARARFRCRYVNGRYPVPSESIIRDVLIRVDPADLDRALRRWN